MKKLIDCTLGLITICVVVVVLSVVITYYAPSSPPMESPVSTTQVAEVQFSSVSLAVNKNDSMSELFAQATGHPRYMNHVSVYLRSEVKPERSAKGSPVVNLNDLCREAGEFNILGVPYGFILESYLRKIYYT